MKKRDLLRNIEALAKTNAATWVPDGGSKHDKYRMNGIAVMIPRHTEIGEELAKAIMKQCQKAIDS